MVAVPKSILMLVSGVVLAVGCSREQRVPLVGRTEFPGQVSFIAEGNVINGYDLSLVLSDATFKRVADIVVYCTLDIPEDAASVLKGYEVKGPDIVLFLTDDSSCGESVDGKLVGEKRIRVAASGP